MRTMSIGAQARTLAEYCLKRIQPLLAPPQLWLNRQRVGKQLGDNRVALSAEMIAVVVVVTVCAERGIGRRNVDKLNFAIRGRGSNALIELGQVRVGGFGLER